MVDFTQSAGALPCKALVCDKCATLRVKCLELRRFGGVPYGECAIRVPVSVRPRPPVSP